MFGDQFRRNTSAPINHHFGLIDADGKGHAVLSPRTTRRRTRKWKEARAMAPSSFIPRMPSV